MDEKKEQNASQINVKYSGFDFYTKILGSPKLVVCCSTEFSLEISSNYLLIFLTGCTYGRSK